MFNSKLLKVHGLAFAAMAAISVAGTTAQAADVLNVKTIGTELARDIADKTVQACDEKGFSVSAVVVDRSGQMIAALRSQFAAEQTITIAGGKARGAIMAGTSTADLVATRPALAANLNLLSDVKMMEGGLTINAGGVRIGAVGVSGAPGGDIDAACAQEALDKLADRFEFAN